jgi:hypothetical protein
VDSQDLRARTPEPNPRDRVLLTAFESPCFMVQMMTVKFFNLHALQNREILVGAESSKF